MKKNILVCALMLFLLSALSGCTHTGPGNFNADGSFTSVEYKNPLPFMKGPVYRMEESVLYMALDGETLFTARVMSDKDIAAYESYGKVAESSNLTVYPVGLHFAYTYILDLKGTDVSFICFETDEAPDGNGPGKEFGVNISYKIGKLETVPDVEGLKPVK